MKKILSITMALMIILSSFAFAVPSDVAGTGYETAVDRLMSLKLLLGYPDGTFRPTATITRAEFAAVVVRSLGLEAAAGNSATTFPDVPASHWASGYVSVAAGLDIVEGYTSGSFGPSDSVTYEQAVAMVVRALGYEPSVKAKGGYPAGYLVIAAENGLLEGVSGQLGSPAPRGLVAQLVNNALDTPMMVQTNFGGAVKYVISGLDGTTLQTMLTQKLGFTEVSKTVATVNTTDAQITFDSDSKTYKVAPGLALTNNLVDLDVTVILKDQMVYLIQINSTILFDFIDGSNHNATEVKLVKANRTYDVDASAISTLDDTIIDTPAFTGAAYDGSYGMFIVNKDNKITRGQLVTQFSNQGVLTSVTEKTAQYINTASATGPTVTLGNMDEADYGFVVIDGKIGQYSNLKVGMFLEYYKDVNDVYTIVASSSKIEGKLESIKTDLTQITIAGMQYDLSGDARYSNDLLDTTADLSVVTDLADLEGTVVTAYKDVYDHIVLISGSAMDSTTFFYGILREANTFNEEIKVEKNINNAVKITTYKFDLTVDDADVAGTHYTTLYDGGLDAADFYRFVLNEQGVVIEIGAVAGITDGTNSTTIDSVDGPSDSIYGNNFSRYFVEEDLTIISIDGGVVSTLSWASMLASTITDGSITMLVATGDSTPDVIFILNDANNELGTYLGNYILAYAPTSPSLSGGKYNATVRTTSGNLNVVVTSADLNGWTDDKAVLTLQKRSNGEYKVIDIEHGDDFFLTDGLTALDDHATEFVAHDAVLNNVTLINGQFVTIGGTVFKVAEDAMIYRSYDDGTTISASTIESMMATDTATFIEKSGVVHFMIYKR